ncbi:expressed protein [Phakopsora pachyrhizi]|uniref:Expressed protein n=1 Tax=Phakopsora pachyrhizi TaxID=170000 RepID=A0AAV0AI15_PHAPC|nr:expressed protein [Phakopsora pachyrhizi]
MPLQSPPVSPQSSSSSGFPSSHPNLPPTLPHSIIPAIYCLAPLDNLHLAHLLNDIKPPPPLWSYDYGSSGPGSSPTVVSNDRLRSDELADLPAPDAERKHAAYDIEDHLDSSPDRLLVYGPSTSLEEVLEDVISVLMKISRRRKEIGTNRITPLNASNQRKTFPNFQQNSKPRYNRDCEVYVARLWFQPKDGPGGLYKWEKGGPDLMRFEIDPDQEKQSESGQPNSHGTVPVINWCPVEVALSQALEVGHKLLALLHSNHFAQLVASTLASCQLKAIDPIIWLVDPVEYAHAQLRENTEWGWSEHHVELNASSFCNSSCLNPKLSGDLRSSSFSKDINRPPIRSHLAHEILQEHLLADQPGSTSAPIVRRASNTSTQCRSSYLGFCSTVQPDELSTWLDDLLNSRLPNLLSSPDGFFSYDLLQPPQPVTLASWCSNNVTKTCATPPQTSISPLSNPLSPLLESSTQNSKLTPSTKLSELSALDVSSRNFGSNGTHQAASVSSVDQHIISSPGPSHPDLAIIRGHRHAQTNTLRYYPCKACAEHAFKIALSHRLDEERKRTLRVIATKQAHILRDKALAGAESLLQASAVQDEALISSATPSAIQYQRWEGIPVPMVPELSNSDQSLPRNSVGSSHQAIGLGLKGKAVKEAMDREDDEYQTRISSLKKDVCYGDCRDGDLINSTESQTNHHEKLKNSDNKDDENNNNNNNISNRCNHLKHLHTWDEGESVED